MRIAVVGCGGFGNVHLNALRELNRSDLEVYVFSRSREKAEECARRYSASGYFTNYDDVVKSNVDIVDLIVSHDMHAPMAIKAMETGKHVILEKPIARTIDEANAIIEASRRLKVKFMVAENFYFDPAVWKAVELIKEIGQVHTIIIRSTHYGKPGGWRRVKELMGGGAFIDGGIHFVDTLLNIGGEYNHACGLSYRTISGIEGEDTTIGLFRFRNGARGLIMYSWGMMHSLNVPSIEVYGEGGSIIEDPSTRRINVNYGRVYGDLLFNGKAINLPKVNVVKAELEGFIKSIEEDKPVPMPPEVALRDLKAVLEVYGNQCL
ncbi:Gfo/Idh/MocA family protein [Caldivirga maquilingensis]|uniref:Oxidoreductase domain protein n=1 Tax=Caldivirga maquilingensis (strain ATCC 700844 / DSM 13496 / JCM 10307 / IC-167) TaxID=397948 RepID=A8MCJ0_CALMQ|nr:Gfo/Idh/MocA family oxidoreductase [Caldivirga maquilingensis]ABW01496.1 oxidoreductase domain protein [Caldivirga maquilingensis IC-167]